MAEWQNGSMAWLNLKCVYCLGAVCSLALSLFWPQSELISLCRVFGLPYSLVHSIVAARVARHLV